MKKLLLLIVLILSNYAFSQNGLFGKDGAFSDKWHKGKLVLKSKDTLVGFVKFDDASKDLTGFSLSNKVKFRATENGKKQKFKKKKVDYFVVTNNSGKTHKYTYLKVKVEGYKLLKIEAEGKLNLYTDEYAYWSNETPNYKSGTTAYVKKPDEKKINYLLRV